MSEYEDELEKRCARLEEMAKEAQIEADKIKEEQSKMRRSLKVCIIGLADFKNNGHRFSKEPILIDPTYEDWCDYISGANYAVKSYAFDILNMSLDMNGIPPDIIKDFDLDGKQKLDLDND